MSNDNPYQVVITSEMIEASMKRARIQRSKAMWSLLQRLFSRPEQAGADEAEVRHATKSGLRLG
jgi:hypothetical protein